MNNVSETDNMKLMKCGHSSQCESEKEFYPDSYCSSLIEGEGKYCCHDCTEEATSAKDASNTTMKFYAQLTVNSVQCNNDNDCTTGDGGFYVSAKAFLRRVIHLSITIVLLLRQLVNFYFGTFVGNIQMFLMNRGGGAQVEWRRVSIVGVRMMHRVAEQQRRTSEFFGLCADNDPRRKQEDLYRCLGGDPAYDTVGDVIKCDEDKDCNKVEGQPLSDQSTWDFECVTAGGPGEGFCCPVAKCKDRFTYMRTENDCETQMDCLKDEEEKKTNADGRAVCSMYYEKNEKKPNNKCCPIGLKRIDGKTHVNSTTCQGTCPDKEIYGTKVPQYCALPSDGSETGVCFLSPYIIIEERNRQVNPVLKTSLIISVVMTLIFAFLALIMFVNYRSKNFCDKYTPKKKKGKKGKKGKKDDTTTGGRSTKGDSSSKSAMSGTSATGTTGGGTTGGGTTGDGTTGGGTTGDASSTGTAA
uniref:DX domain-containing protein n=1 Tax=Angiostrongylus cantonensis TaxID=6313 RepID=A0A158P9X4_ANGCA